MKNIRIHLSLFIILLLLSGITAFPLKQEINLLFSHFENKTSVFAGWIKTVHEAINSTPDLLFYGTDWLAFAHIVISLFFVPVYLDPSKYKINVIVGMAACALILPLAFICGPIRGIPFFHQLIDCAFGVLGIAYLGYILKKINQLKPTIK